jgi:hypothetical protein
MQITQLKIFFMKKIIIVGTAAHQDNSDAQIWEVNFYSSSAISDGYSCDFIQILSWITLLLEIKLPLPMHCLLSNYDHAFIEKRRHEDQKVFFPLQNRLHNN